MYLFFPNFSVVAVVACQLHKSEVAATDFGLHFRAESGKHFPSFV